MENFRIVKTIQGDRIRYRNKDCLNPNCKTGELVFDTFCEKCREDLDIFERINIANSRNLFK